MYQDELVHPHYEVSIDLKLDENTHKDWSNIFGFHQDHQRPITEDGGYAIGGRIPAVFVRPGENKLHICSAIGTNGNTCWNSGEYTAGKWFNLKIKECFKIIQANTKPLYIQSFFQSMGHMIYLAPKPWVIDFDNYSFKRCHLC